MLNFLGRRGVTAVLALIAVSMIGAPANAQSATSLVAPAVPAVALAPAAKPFPAEAAWLHQGGWSLSALVDKYAANEQLDEQMNCLATAVYFEARGESAEGQLAVARVVMNRAASGKYPPSWCATVKQPWQFSFVRHGQFPSINTGDPAWGRAIAVAKLAAANVVPSLSNDVLWYHANYVRPAWGPRLTRVEKIGAHIFYRS